jgi:hypothetical protein
MRAKVERIAAGRSNGSARSRHEELAAAYQMRVMCIDKGYCDPATESARERAAPPSEPGIILQVTVMTGA